MTIKFMIGRRFALLPDPVETESEGGILLPAEAQKKKQSGTITHVGLGGLDQYGNFMPMRVKVGDRVLYSKYSLAEIKVNGVEYLTGDEDSLICVLEEEDEPLSFLEYLRNGGIGTSTIPEGDRPPNSPLYCDTCKIPVYGAAKPGDKCGMVTGAGNRDTCPGTLREVEPGSGEVVSADSHVHDFRFAHANWAEAKKRAEEANQSFPADLPPTDFRCDTCGTPAYGFEDGAKCPMNTVGSNQLVPCLGTIRKDAAVSAEVSA